MVAGPPEVEPHRSWGQLGKCWSKPLVEDCDQHGSLVADGKLVEPRGHGPVPLEAIDSAFDGMLFAVVGLVELRRPTCAVRKRIAAAHAAYLYSLIRPPGTRVCRIR